MARPTNTFPDSRGEHDEVTPYATSFWWLSAGKRISLSHGFEIYADHHKPVVDLLPLPKKGPDQ